MAKQENFLGIDIGTTTIEISQYVPGQSRVDVIKFPSGEYYYPVYYARATNSLKEQFGVDAKICLNRPRMWTVAYEIKRLIGKKYKDPNVQNELSRLTYQTEELPDGSIGIVFPYKKEKNVLTPIQIYELIFREILLYLDSIQVKHEYAIITVPNDFTDAERTMIKNMFENKQGLAFHMVKILNEPTAAALDFQISDDMYGKYAIFDYGGGTLDLSVVDMTQNDGEFGFKVLSYDGMRDNGGSDIDYLLMDYVINQLKITDYWKDAYEYIQKNKSKLKTPCEECKVQLSTVPSAKVSVDPQTGDENIAEVDITIQEFENICKDIFTRALEKLVSMIEPYKKELKGILMVGGTSNIPLLQKMIKAQTGIQPIVGKHPLLAVSRGAAIKGSSIEIDLDDIASYSVSIATTHPIIGFDIPLEIIKKGDQLNHIKNVRTLHITSANQRTAQIELYANCEGLLLPEKLMGIYECDLPEGCKVNDRIETKVEMIDGGTIKFYFTFIDLPLREIRVVEYKLK